MCSVDLKGLVEQNKHNFIPPTSRMTNYVVLKFGNHTDPTVSLNLTFFNTSAAMEELRCTSISTLLVSLVCVILNMAGN